MPFFHLPRSPAGLAFTLGLIGWAAAGRAAPPPGDYRLDEGHRSFEIGDWGADCGPRPSSERFGAGPRYTLDAAGWLQAQGRAPAVFQRDICAAATGIPSLKSTPSGARIRCTSTVPAQSVTGYVQRDDRDPNRLQISERLAYDWALKGTRCTLTQHARWVLSRVEPLDRCRTPGPVVHLERQGAARQSLVPGRALRFRAEAQDAAGCPVPVAPTWTTTLGQISAEGVLQVAADQATGSGEVSAQVGAVQTRWQVTVRVPRQRPTAQPEAAVAVEELLPEWLEDPLEPDGDGIAPEGAPQLGGAASAQVGVAAAPAHSPLLIALFVGLGLAAVAIAGWILWSSRRLRRQPSRVQALLAARPPRVADPRAGPARAPSAKPRAPAQPEPPAQAPPAEAPPDEPPGEGPLVCPRCDRHFEGGSRFCPFDGTALEEAALDPSADPDLLATVAMPTLQAKVCPVCETRYPEAAEFCGLDGARLVLLN